MNENNLNNQNEIIENELELSSGRGTEEEEAEYLATSTSPEEGV